MFRTDDMNKAVLIKFFLDKEPIVFCEPYKTGTGCKVIFEFKEISEDYIFPKQFLNLISLLKLYEDYSRLLRTVQIIHKDDKINA